MEIAPANFASETSPTFMPRRPRPLPPLDSEDHELPSGPTTPPLKRRREPSNNVEMIASGSKRSKNGMENELDHEMIPMVGIGNKEGQEDSGVFRLLELPVEVIERCFNLTQNLSLADHIAVSQTCKQFRDAYDEVAWEGLYEHLGPPLQNGQIIDSYSLTPQLRSQKSETSLAISGHIVKFEREFYCNRVREKHNEDDEYRYRSMHFRNGGVDDRGGVGTNEGRRSQVQAMIETVEEHNRLGREWVPRPKESRQAEYRRLNPQIYPIEYPPHMMEYYPTLEIRQERQKRQDEQIKIDAAKLSEQRKKWEPYIEDCCRFALSQMPLSRGELASMGGDDRRSQLKGNVMKLTPFHVLCLRAVNWPVMTPAEIVARTDMNPSDFKNVLKPLGRGLVCHANGKPNDQVDWYLQRDVERLRIKLQPKINERAQRDRIAALTRLAALQLEKNKWGDMGHPPCEVEWCKKSHALDHAHYAGRKVEVGVGNEGPDEAGDEAVRVETGDEQAEGGEGRMEDDIVMMEN